MHGEIVSYERIGVVFKKFIMVPYYSVGPSPLVRMLLLDAC